jgi:hypothetical protein
MLLWRKEMRAPYTRIDGFTVRYKQIPYDNRYFFVYFDKQEIAKIPRYLEKYNLIYRLLDLEANRKWDVWYNFLERVRKYDEYLDEWD